MTAVPDREPAVDVRPAGSRFVTTTDWLVSRHSFSFGQHYDPDNVGFGPLIVLNEDHLEPGAGFEPHPHAGVDIVTWVLSGALRHEDSQGHAGVARPGRMQRMSAAGGITHAERTEGAQSAHYVQMWLASDQPGTEPAYDLLDVDDDLALGGLVAVASGRAGVDAGLTLRNPRATLHAARLGAGDEVELPVAPLVHLFVTRGDLQLAGASLEVGDAVRLQTTSGLLTAVTEGEVLVWELHTD